MKYRVSAVLFFIAAIGFARTGAAQKGPCTGKAPGTYCAGEMIMTCKGTAEATAVGCGIAMGADGKELRGRCVSTGPNDNKAACKMDAPPAGPCSGKAPGTYCAGEMIMTCKGTAEATAVGCGLAISKDGKELRGRCVSTGPNDNKAACKMDAPPAGPCSGKAPGTYCAGEMIMTCKGTAEATAVGCGVAIGKDGKELRGRCVSTGPNDNKAACKLSQ